MGATETFVSAVLGQERSVNVWTPPAYVDEPQRTFPTLYVLDGSADEDFHHVSGLVQFLTMYQLMPPTIVVGIGNVDRYHDFTRPPSRGIFRRQIPHAGGAAAFRRFVDEELVPYVDTHYRTNRSATLLGQSLGGLFALECLADASPRFERYVVVSPSAWWNDGDVIARAETTLRSRSAGERQLTVVLALGSEGEMMQAAMDALVGVMRRTAPKSVRWHTIALPAETHATVMHRASYLALEWIYGEEFPGL